MRRFVLILGALISLAAGWPGGGRRLAAERAVECAHPGHAERRWAGGAYVQDLTTGNRCSRGWPTPAGCRRRSRSLHHLDGAAPVRAERDAGDTVLAAGTLDRHHGFHGILWLKGGGDPTFGSAVVRPVRVRHRRDRRPARRQPDPQHRDQVDPGPDRRRRHVLRRAPRHPRDRLRARPDRCRGAARRARLRPWLRQLRGHGRAAAAGAVRDPAVRRCAPGARRQDRLEHRRLHGAGAEARNSGSPPCARP